MVLTCSGEVLFDHCRCRHTPDVCCVRPVYHQACALLLPVLNILRAFAFYQSSGSRSSQSSSASHWSLHSHPTLETSAVTRLYPCSLFGSLCGGDSGGSDARACGVLLLYTHPTVTLAHSCRKCWQPCNVR